MYSQFIYLYIYLFFFLYLGIKSGTVCRPEGVPVVTPREPRSEVGNPIITPLLANGQTTVLSTAIYLQLATQREIRM